MGITSTRLSPEPENVSHPNSSPRKRLTYSSPYSSRKDNAARSHGKLSHLLLLRDGNDDDRDEDGIHHRRSSRAGSNVKSDTVNRNSKTHKKRVHGIREFGRGNRATSKERSAKKSGGQEGQARQARKAEKQRKHDDKMRTLMTREVDETERYRSREGARDASSKEKKRTHGLKPCRRTQNKPHAHHSTTHRDEKDEDAYQTDSSSTISTTSPTPNPTTLVVPHHASSPAPPTQECTICTSHLPLTRFPKHAATSNCTHTPSTCRRCLRTWLQTSFQTKLWDQLTCPECGAQLQHADVRRCAGRRVFEKYDGLATKAALEAIEGFRWCLVRDGGKGRRRGRMGKGRKKGGVGDGGKKEGVVGGCGSGQIHGVTAKMQCIGCGTVQCVKHAVLWHEGETCAEYDYRTDSKLKKAEEASSLKCIKQTTKKCPNCKRNIEKASGCDHMTCSKCKHEFCWLCSAAYEPIRERGNHLHESNCQYYPS